LNYYETKEPSEIKGYYSVNLKKVYVESCNENEIILQVITEISHRIDKKTQIFYVIDRQSYSYSNGKIIESRFLNYRNYRRMDFPVFTSRGSAPVLSTARFKNIPVSSTITIRVGLTYKIPAGSIGAISTKHIIKVR